MPRKDWNQVTRRYQSDTRYVPEPEPEVEEPEDDTPVWVPEETP